MSLSQQARIVEPGVAEDIHSATQHLAEILHRIETGQQEMDANTVRQLEEATRVLEELVEQAN